jgi:dihydropyrimidine dehydrogenase (NAD+) subunit PreT
MPSDRAKQEVDWVLAIGGIEVKTGVSVPGDVSWEELERRHDALFLGFGLGPDSALFRDGAELEGVQGAVEWIEQMKLGQISLEGVRRALVVGGGNTALDVVRELAGLGVPEVTMVYRGDEAGMSGYAHEWEAAKVDGVRAAWRTQPVGYLAAGGKVTGLRCVRLDAQKQAVPGSEHELAAELVLLAIGQSKLGELVAGLEGVALDRGRVVVGEGGATGRPGVFAGGDCANGGKEVVNGVAEGRDAAVAIDAWLTKGGV